jgi:hypothetical protein
MLIACKFVDDLAGNAKAEDIVARDAKEGHHRERW